jgi:hypothetical protein
MKINPIFLFVSAALAAMAGCGKGVQPSEDIPDGIGVRSCLLTRADGDEPAGRDQQPVFLFWTEGNFNNPSAGEPDFFACTPDDGVDAYSEISYNTKVPYPSGNAAVKATGFAPAPGDGYLAFVTEGDYSQFTIPSPDVPYPDDTHGVMDVLASRSSVSGSNSSHISEPLEFIHAQTRLSFQATLSGTMSKFVKFVRVQFPGSLAPMSLEFNETKGIYEVKGGTDGIDDFVFGNFWTTNGTSQSSDPRANFTMSFQLGSDRKQNMGYTHLALPEDCTGIDVHVLYELANGMNDFGPTIGTGTDVSEMDVPVHIDFVDADKDPVALSAGDAYNIVLVFDTYNIEIIGQPARWQDGGYVSIPIQIR